MGMAAYIPPKRIPRFNGSNYCKRCDADYINNGGWVRYYDSATGTQSPQLSFVSKIPSGVCPLCEQSQESEG